MKDNKTVKDALKTLGFNHFSGDVVVLFPLDRHKNNDYKPVYVVTGIYPDPNGSDNAITSIYSSRLLDEAAAEKLRFKWFVKSRYHDQKDLSAVITIQLTGEPVPSIRFFDSSIMPDETIDCKDGILIVEEGMLMVSEFRKR